MKCPKCSLENRSSNITCVNCGYYLKSDISNKNKSSNTMVSLTDKTFAVELPNGRTTGILIPKVTEDNYLVVTYHPGMFLRKSVILNHKLPTGSYTLLFLSKNASEDDAEKITKQELPGSWWNYEKPGYGLRSAIQSFQSLLKSKFLDTNKNYAIIQQH